MATEISVKIILDSISPEGKRLTTMHWRYPRFIHSEVMTHRVFSRNARSSRAVPGQTLIAELMGSAAVIPLHWGAKQKGMQAENETDASIWFKEIGETGIGEMPIDVSRTAEEAWLVGRDQMVELAQGFIDAGYHKQVYNRLLEPWLHIDTLVTATEYENFLWLRDHKDAEPHIKILAQKVKEAMDASTPQLLQPGQWHLPYIDAQVEDDGQQSYRYDLGEGGMTFIDLETALKVSAARAARISYRPFDGNGSLEAEIARYESLIASDRVHASPVEHQAKPDTKSMYRVERITDDGVTKKIDVVRQGLDWDNPDKHGNFIGWQQHRKFIPNEAVW